MELHDDVRDFARALGRARKPERPRPPTTWVALSHAISNADERIPWPPTENGLRGDVIVSLDAWNAAKTLADLVTEASERSALDGTQSDQQR